MNHRAGWHDATIPDRPIPCPVRVHQKPSFDGKFRSMKVLHGRLSRLYFYRNLYKLINKHECRFFWLVEAGTVANFSQMNSPLQLFTPLEPDTLLPIRLTGNERLGGSYSFTIEALAARGTPISFGKVLGLPGFARLTTPGGLDRYFSGIIWEIAKKDGDKEFDRYSVVLRPSLDRLGLVKRTRLFQDLSALQILEKLLEPVGGAEFKLSRPLLPRAYCVQYQETDLEFFLRLCSEEGITHYWLHLSTGHNLILIDDTTSTQPLQTIPFNPNLGGTVDDRPRFVTWNFSQSLAPSSMQVADSHFQLAGMRLDGEGRPPVFVPCCGQELRFPDAPAPWQEEGHPQGRAIDGVSASGLPSKSPPLAGEIDEQLRGVAARLARGAVAGSIRAHADGQCPQLAPGIAFLLVDCNEQNGPWLTVAVEHEVVQEWRSGVGHAEPLRVVSRVESAPLLLAQAPWPPRAKPRVGGVYTAEVIGLPGQEMDLDAYGRVRVRFWCDATEGASGCWVRVAQVWAGNGWGAAFWPRVGHEVVVAFEGGDPDRPLIVGSVYNSKNMPPYPLPAAAYVAGFKSCTERGNPRENFHHFLLNDQQQDASILLHAETQFISTQEQNQVSLRPAFDLSIRG